MNIDLSNSKRETVELLEISYTGLRTARDEDQVRHWEGHIEELEHELSKINHMMEWVEMLDEMERKLVEIEAA